MENIRAYGMRESPVRPLSGKLAVYTCITAGYDTLKVPVCNNPDVSYFCFTDDPSIVREPWIYRPIGQSQLSAKDQARFVKMHPHKVLPEYAFTLYVDGSIEVVRDVSAFLHELSESDGDIFIYQHPIRDCVFEEAVVCCNSSLEWFWKISAQMRRYAGEGYPQHDGLFETNVMARRNTPEISRMMDMWWAEYFYGAKRDQLSLTYVSRTLSKEICSLGRSDPHFTHNYFKVAEHQLKHRFRFRKHINRHVARLIGYERLMGVKNIEAARETLRSSRSKLIEQKQGVSRFL